VERIVILTKDVERKFNRFIIFQENKKEFKVRYRILLVVQAYPNNLVLLCLATLFHTRGRILMEILKVSTKSQPKSVAGALAALIKEKNVAEIQAVGAGAVNQAVKAIAITRGYVAPKGIDLVAIPAFSEIEIDGEERTAIKFIVEAR